MLLFIISGCRKPTDQPKYIFLFIGDGMGLAQVNLTEAYFSSVDTAQDIRRLSFTGFPSTGFVRNEANDRLITGSAAAGTAFATGHKTNIGRISMDPSGTVPYKSIATHCKEHGMKVGIISSVSINHATPAVFYSHQPSRNNYFDIGLDLAGSNFDFFAGGGFNKPEGVVNGDSVNLYSVVQDSGFTLVRSDSGLRYLKKNPGKVMAVSPHLLYSGAMPYSIDDTSSPTLAEFTAKAIELLDNENGFFMMVEGGKIDWACHSDDAASAVHETIAFDDAVKEALKFYKAHPNETLIVVTADHETGGLALGTGKTKYSSHYEYLQYQKVSYDKFNDIIAGFQERLSGNFEQDLDSLLKLTSDFFGFDKGVPISEEDKSRIWFSFENSLREVEEAHRSHGDYSPKIKLPVQLMSEKAGIGWSTYSHTGINVPVYAIGPGAELFSGTIDNTDIPKIMMKKLGIEQSN